MCNFNALRNFCLGMAVFFASLYSLSFAQTTEDRVAVIIGNSNYPKPATLKNPINDAVAIGELLKRFSFEVSIYKDTNTQQVNEIRQFIERRVKRDTVFFFYYAGHGVQIDGRNYLISIDARSNNSELIAEDSLYLGDILAAIEKKRPKLATIILDACRDNPFKNEKKQALVQKGLARVDPPSSTVIFYATRPGGTAADGDGSNGLYTKYLLTEIVKPDQPLEVIFRKTSTNVFDISKGEQEPWVEGVIRQEFLISQIPNSFTNQTLIASNQVKVETTQIQVDKNTNQAESYQQAESTKEFSLSSLSMLSSEDITNRLRSFKEQASKDIKNSFVCDGNGCYDYKIWATSLRSESNIDKLKEQLKSFTNSSYADICTFSLQDNKCLGTYPKLWVVYPLLFTRPPTLRGMEFAETKITNAGNLSFKSLPDYYAGESRKGGCIQAEGQLSFSLEQINLDISRHTCFNVIVPASVKNSFQVLYVDLSKREIVAKWNLSMISVLAFGGGEEVIKIKYR